METVEVVAPAGLIPPTLILESGWLSATEASLPRPSGCL